MIHIYYNNLITGENLYSKLSLVDLAGSEGLIAEDDSGERITDVLHVMKSLSAYAHFFLFFLWFIYCSSQVAMCGHIWSLLASSCGNTFIHCNSEVFFPHLFECYVAQCCVAISWLIKYVLHLSAFQGKKMISINTLIHRIGLWGFHCICDLFI